MKIEIIKIGSQILCLNFDVYIDENFTKNVLQNVFIKLHEYTKYNALLEAFQNCIID